MDLDDDAVGVLDGDGVWYDGGVEVWLVVDAYSRFVFLFVLLYWVACLVDVFG